MKVLFVDNGFGNPNGDGRDIDVLMELLTAHGHEVACFFGREANENRSPINKVKDLTGGIYSPLSALQLKKILERFNPDFVHVANVNPLLSTLLLSTIMDNGVPLILDCAHLERSMIGKIVAMIMPGIDLYLVDDEEMRQNFIEQGIKSKRVEVLENKPESEQLYIDLVNVYFKALSLSMRKR